MQVFFCSYMNQSSIDLIVYLVFVFLWKYATNYISKLQVNQGPYK